jgi:hypothetical protein
VPAKKMVMEWATNLKRGASQMKIRLTAIAAILSFSGLISLPVIADETTTTTTTATTTVSTTPVVKKKYKHVHHQSHKHNNTSTSMAAGGGTTIPADPSKLLSDQQDYLPFDPDVPGKAFVSTGPYIGVPFEFAGTNLIINSPSVNTDVQLLQVRKSILNHLDKRGQIVKNADNSHLLFSGVVEGAANYYDRGGYPSTTTINLSSVGLDAFFIGPSDWTLGYFELNYEDANPGNTIFITTNQYTVANSRVFVNRAFITIGDFQRSPFYGSIGQFYVPFGVYSSVMVSNPLTKTLMRTKARSILVGFQQQDGTPSFFGAAYLFPGDSHAQSVDKVNNGGLNFGIKFDQAAFSKYIFHSKIGVGVIANIADSAGMQLLNGFATNSSTEQISHRVAGYDVNAKFGLGESIDVIFEYVTAASRFASNDMSYEGHGAKPWATDTEVAYSFDAFGRPTSVGLAYSTSTQALSLGLPLKRTALVANTSIWKQTIQSLEFRFDREYAASAIASGAGAVASTPETGKIDTSVTAQFDYYF